MLKEELEDRHIAGNWWIWLIAILGMAVATRLYFLPYDLPPGMDGVDYFAYSLEIRNLGELPKNWPLGNNGWPSFMGLLFSIIPSEEFLDYVNFYRISSVIISTITIIPIYFISSNFFGKHLGLLGAALFAFEPRLMINSTMIMNEPIFILLITLIILLFFYRNSKNLIIVFGLIALATHIRYESLIFIIPASILFFLNSGKDFKDFQKYFLAIFVFLIILIPFLALNYFVTGQDGISNHYLSAVIQDYDQLVESDFSNNVYLNEKIDDENKNYDYILNGLSNGIKFLGYSLVPIFILLIPYGIFCIFKERNFIKNVIIILSIFMILPAIYAYMNGFNDIRYLFILYPIFSFLSLFTLQKIKNKIKKQYVFFILILFLLISIGIIANFEQNEQNELLKEYFFVSQKVVDLATGYNQFSSASQYVKAAEIENRWTGSLVSTQSGHFVKEKVLIPYDEHKTLLDYIENSRDIEKIGMVNHPHHQFWFTDASGTKLLDPFYYLSDGTKKQAPVGLSHIIADDRDETPKFIQDVYFNEEKYPFLIKKFDSGDFDLKYNVKIFEINYKKFE